MVNRHGPMMETGLFSGFKFIFDAILIGGIGFLIAGPIGLMLGLIVAALLYVQRTLAPKKVAREKPSQSWLENVFDRVLGKP
jgi:ABC-type antimicrobial peptide transport system permease subunit